MLYSGKVFTQVPENLQHFDDKKIHFGFSLGYNKSDFYLDKKDDFSFNTDSLLSLQTETRPGFSIGIVSSLKLAEDWSLRFLPNLSFQERALNYTYYVPVDSSILRSRPVEPVFLDFPLLFKFRTDRIGNFAAYFLGGGRFGLDMQSQKHVDNEASAVKDQIVKIAKSDYGIELGGGVDFFLPYFKLGFELKLGVGLKDILIHENTMFANPIEQLRSKVWSFSITFEG